MDKNKIKSFAIWARRNLIEAVSEKAYRIGISKNNIEDVIVVQGGFKLQGKEGIIPLSNSDRNALVAQVREKGFEQVMEEVAYTWFNRFMGLRYMEVNDYLPTGVRVLSSEDEGKAEPDVLTKVSEVIDDLKLNAEEIYELIDSGKTDDREKAYKIILVKQCNELGKIIPQMFEKISDYIEALLPDNLLEEGSVIRKMVEDIAEEDWMEEVEIIGWMYQYYISEKKDEVFAALKKNVKITKENIPAATQLFTPKWIVKYMVENSLGRLWLEGHPNEELQKTWKYYLEEAEQEPDVEIELQKIREEHGVLRPEDIKVLDPCMGSGHILVYAFDVLYEIYKTAGYSEREIPRMILQNNLYGLDIDDRAAQLASFALIMKARHYNRRLFREIEKESIDLNLCSVQESNAIEQDTIEYFSSLKTGLDNKELQNDLEYLVTTFTDAKEYGSILEVKEVNFEALKQRLKEIENEDNLMFGDYRKILLDKVPAMIKQVELMSRVYEVCITNPPYMGNKGMSKKLWRYINDKYSISKSDLYAVFIERNFKFLKENGYNSMVTMHSWLFQGSFEIMRTAYINKYTFNTILHLGMEAFDGIAGKVVQTAGFTLCKKENISYKTTAVRLVDFYDSRRYEKEKQFFNIENRYSINQKLFNIIPTKQIAYWISNNIFNIFEKSDKLGDYAMPLQGMQTCDNERFLRFWSEINYLNFSTNSNSYDSKFKWYPYTKGGKYRKWYGNNEYVINYLNEGFEIKQKRESSGQSTFLPGCKKYFKEGLTWTSVTNTDFSMRYCSTGFIFDQKGPMCFSDKIDIVTLCGFMNSKIVNVFLKVLAPTLDYSQGPLKLIPIRNIEISNKLSEIKEISKKCINIARHEWNSVENSWEFKQHPLLKLLDKGERHRLDSVFYIWEAEYEEEFEQLKANEEELNKIFIDIYGLQDELTPEVADKDITIRKADRVRDIKSFISYAVGCMFGRYSIDSEGLIYAGGDFSDKWDLNNKKVRSIEKDEEGNIISDFWTDVTFVPHFNNIIPITEDEYFEDDIVSRFIDFVRIVYSDDTLEDNLDFIADSIGRKASETSRQGIRRYFIKDFYKDHLKVYQKRPIYWMFDSGKNDGFKVLVYMHRYNEQTVAKLRTDYLHSLQRKYEAAIQMQVLIQDSDSSSAKDKVTAKKKIDRISKQIEECREYDQVVAHLANEKISIDLDDGVKVNYAKFQGVDIINSKDKKVSMNLLAKI